MSTLLATGAYLKNSACLWMNGQWQMSAVHGDLATPAARIALETSVDTLLAKAGGRVDAVAHDLHPDFHSTHVAQDLAAQLGVPAIGVQHHAAHIGVTLAEQGITGPVVGIALDGVGLGEDGTAWGGELLHVHGAAWSRVGHLGPLALPGGDRAAQEPWRMAAAALFALGRGDEIEARFAPRVGEMAARGVAAMLQRGLNCPPTTSTGRWFDAAAAALGLCDVQHQEAQAAMALEALAGECDDPPPPLPTADAGPMPDGSINLRPLLSAVFDCADRGQHARGARLFHDTLADALARAAHAAASRAGTTTVVLGGGCFFNHLLTARLTATLRAAGLQVLQPGHVGCGDAGLALGQAWMAAQRLLQESVLHETPKEALSCA